MYIFYLNEWYNKNMLMRFSHGGIPFGLILKIRQACLLLNQLTHIIILKTSWSTNVFCICILNVKCFLENKLCKKNSFNMNQKICTKRK